MIDQSCRKRGGTKSKRSKAILTCLIIILGSAAILPVTMQTRQASAEPTEATSIYIDPNSAIKGEQVIIRGFLSSTNYPNANLTGQQINITLSDLEGNLPDVVLDPVFTENEFGDFFVNFTAPSEAAYWQVNANFTGDDQFLPSTGSGIFATVEPGAMSFEASDGQAFYSNVNVTLTNFTFATSLNFEFVPEDYLLEPINVTVSQCVSPDTSTQSRYLPLSFDTSNNTGNICLEIFPGPLQQLDNKPKIAVNMSYAGVESLPDGYSENNIDLFYYDVLTGEITEITASRNVDNHETSGSAPDIGRFIVGIGLHGQPAEGAIRQHVFAGDNQQVMFRNITNTANTTASVVSISPDEITLEEPVTITLNYTNGNVDVSAIDQLSVRINSTSSTPDNITISFTESSGNSGIFTGSLTLTSGNTSGSLLRASTNDTLTFTIPGKDSTDGRFRAVLDGVAEAGVVELSDYELTEAELDFIINEGFTPVVGIVNMTLVDATLDEFDGQLHVTMSYANGLIGQDPSALKIYHKRPGSGWGTPPVAVLDTTNLLVSATFNIFDISTPGLFALAFPTGSPGGAGGGLGRPGVGVVLDFLAPFASPPPSDGDEDSGDSGGSNGASEGSGRRVVIVNQQTSTFPESYFAEHPLERVQVSGTAFLNAAGTSISNGNVGQQMSISSTFTNHQQQSQSYSFIVLIMDEDGIAIDIAWQEGIVEAGETVDLSSSWMPEDDGNYTVKIFVWDGFESPTPLSSVVVNQLSVV